MSDPCQKGIFPTPNFFHHNLSGEFFFLSISFVNSNLVDSLQNKFKITILQTYVHQKLDLKQATIPGMGYFSLLIRLWNKVTFKFFLFLHTYVKFPINLSPKQQRKMNMFFQTFNHLYV